MVHPQDEKKSTIERAFRRRRSMLRDVALHSREDVEDIYQDAFTRIIERAQAQEISQLDNLLRHVVRCLAIDRIRRKDSRRTFTSDRAGENAVDAAADPERHVMGVQRLRRVMSAIDSMPPKRKEVFMLHRIEEMTYAQIARHLSISIKTVEKHIALAMRQLSDTDD
ncbi:MAG: sigma-70 family RNA polymerase sigma factor [Burkholderiales bacterium]|nr:MAG: sigma-70 family RNA polymerase sigma factor [Burkholderiales bacterium]